MSDIPVPAPLTLHLFDQRSTCGFLDITCHLQLGLWTAWDGLGLGWQALVVLALLAIVLGALRGFLGLVRDIAGWPAVAGVVAIVLAIIVAMLPRRPKSRAPSSSPAAKPRPQLPHLPFGTGQKPGSRRYDETTNTWVDK